MDPCTHEWSIRNVRHGYLVEESCFECEGRRTFFCDEPIPPIEEYREGRHFWAYRNSFQTVKFNLLCRTCGRTINLKDVNGLMLSHCTDFDCAVGVLVRQQGPDSPVCVAVCPNTTHPSDECVSRESIEALTQYMNAKLAPRRKKITVVPCKLCNSFDRCRGTGITDAGLAEIQNTQPAVVSLSVGAH
jgi:hypothetical protein